MGKDGKENQGGQSLDSLVDIDFKDTSQTTAQKIGGFFKKVSDALDKVSVMVLPSNAFDQAPQEHEPPSGASTRSGSMRSTDSRHPSPADEGWEEATLQAAPSMESLRSALNSSSSDSLAAPQAPPVKTEERGR
jgi:hypothetical protein